MKTSENNQQKHENDGQVDDLTRFLDEDFDTDDVDLFEFTTEEDSPLTELKSIVLSLDWEITDDTLQDLADEIQHLKELEMFQADKVSQVYLQGLAKIGHYIQSEGAHAHPNSIKLLLTLYYDFEKVLSSETITGSEITALLKADVRKFKILQYQIAQKHGVEAPVSAAAEAKELGLVITDSEALRGIQAIILELDWEITDDSLERLTEQLNTLKKKFEDDRFIQVLIQGLYSLNTYIKEEKGQAHPETFSLLHTFCDGLARLIENNELGDEERQAIIVEHVNSLNNLKALIAGGAETVEVLDEDAITEYEEKPSREPSEEEPAPAVERTTPAPEAEEKPEPPVATAPGEDVEIAPALAGDESEGTEILEEEPPEELADRLDSFFGVEEQAPPSEQAPAPEAIVADEPDIIPGLTDEDELEQAPVPTVEESEEDPDIAPALAGDESEGTEIVEEEPPEELAENLDLFFGKEEGIPEPDVEPEAAVPEEPGIIPAPAPADEDELEETPALTGYDIEEDLDIMPALSGDESEGSEIPEEEPQEELALNLESFFGSEEEVAPFEGTEPPPVAEEVTAVAEEPEEALGDEEEIIPALAGSPEEAGFGVETELEEPPEGLAEKLDGFFGEEEPVVLAEAETPVAQEAEEGFEAMLEEEEYLSEELEAAVTPALADEFEESEIQEEAPPEELAEKLKAFFGDEETVADEASEAEEEMLLTPALAEEELNIPGPARPMKTEEDYQVAVAQIRTHFKEQEDRLRQEIDSLKEEIVNLRTQLDSK